MLASDGSKETLPTVVDAMDLCEKIGSELHVIHFRSIPETSGDRAKDSAFQHTPRREALPEQPGRPRRAGIGATAHTQVHLKTGWSAEKITKLAGAIGAELVLIGDKSHGVAHRLLVGDIVERLVRLSRCPVLVMRASGEGESVKWPPKRIVVGVDLSEGSKRTAAYSAALAAALEAELSMVLAYYRLPEAMQPQGLTALSTDEEATFRAWRWLDRLSRRLETSLGYRPLFKILPGETVAVIGRAVEEGEQPALTVVGARRMSLRQRTLLGSVSSALLRSSDGPVLVVPLPPACASETSLWAKNE